MSLEQGCPTRGPTAACGPLGKLVRPFLPLSSLTPFFKGGEIFLGRENFSRKVNFVEMSEEFWRAFGRYSGENMRFSKKGHQKNLRKMR